MRTFNHVGMVLKEKMDDMIYVEPNKSLGVKSSAFYTFLSAGASILGLASSIVALVFAIKNEAK